MKKILLITGYFISFWILIPVAIYFSSGYLDDVFFPGRYLSGGWVMPGLILALIGILMVLRSVQQFKLQSGEYPVSATPPQKIIMKDVFIIWRHPVYLFASVALVGAAMILKSIAMLTIVIPSFLIFASLYIIREEAILVRRFGRQYRYYRNNVSLLIPHFHHWLRIPGAIMFRILFRLKIQGRENLPDSLPFIVVSGHRHYFDPFLVSYAIPCPLKHISTLEMFRSPVNRVIFKWFGAIPRRRFEKDIHGLQKIIAALKSGHPVCMFPEGGRSWTGRLRSFKPEALKLLRLFNDIPVVPVRIEGNYHSWPRWADKLMRSDITITIGKSFTIDPGMSLEVLQDFLLQMVKPGEDIESEKRCFSKNRISHLSKVIYRCPLCLNNQPPEEIMPDTLKCRSCSNELRLGSDFNLEFVNSNPRRIETIHAIYDSVRIKYSEIHQLLSEEIADNITNNTEQDERILYVAPGQLWAEKKSVFVTSVHGLCILSDKSLTIRSGERSEIIPLEEIGAVTIESNYKLQIYNEIRKILHQITFDDDSALKWQDILVSILGNQFKKQIITR